MSLFAKVRWAFLDCITGTGVPVEKLPFHIGSGHAVDLKLNGGRVCEQHCAIQAIKGVGVCLVRGDEQAMLIVNGQPVDVSPLEPNSDYTICLGDHLLALRGEKRIENWTTKINFAEWWLVEQGSEAPEGPWPLLDLCHTAIQTGRDPFCMIYPSGMETGFYLGQALETLGPLLQSQRATAQPNTLPGAPFQRAVEVTAPDRGAFRCPVCWLRFDAGDVLHVAVHDSLRGDPLLGVDVQQRFQATRFNDLGQALDPLGLPSSDMACPHCRRVLPPGFLEAQEHIFSIVGDQSAGKSYYLTTVVRRLQTVLARDFSVLFQDADPAGNALLNQMKTTLFGATTPADAMLAKTQLEGAMYERLPRYGRIVALPKPFSFYMSAQSRPEKRSLLIFYDNAGEHFQPGRDSADSPGAQHIACSSGVLFLFDPLAAPEFRLRLQNCPDPQVEKPALDQQDVILAEMRVRLQKLLNLPPGRKIVAPLAFLVGKADAWMHLLGTDVFKNPIRKRSISLADMEYNSCVVRELLFETCPNLVANAESISERILYFPVSSFGHTPVKLAPGNYVPEPSRLKPFMVEAPVLWLLHQLTPEIVPTAPE
jgi:hypothetical protein